MYQNFRHKRILILGQSSGTKNILNPIFFSCHFYKKKKKKKNSKSSLLKSTSKFFYSLKLISFTSYALLFSSV